MIIVIDTSNRKDKMSNESLSKDLKNYFELGKDKNVIIKTDPVITAHAQILCARSDYFSKLLSPIWARKENNSYVINCPDCSHDVMYKIILYLYTDNIDLENLDLETIINIIITSDKFSLCNLNAIILEYLKPQVETLTDNNLVTFVNFVTKHDFLRNYFDLNFKYVLINIKSLLTKTDLRFTKESIMFLVESDDLGMTESELLHFLHNGNYEIELENIRVHQIESNKVIDLLWQYHDSSNKYILKDVLCKKLEPSYLTKYGINWIRYSNINHMSKILKSHDIHVLEKMFKCRFRLELIFSASETEHELTSEDLYDVCEGKSSILIIGRSSVTGLLGAYNDGFWVSGTMQIENSFLFKMSLKDKERYNIAEPTSVNTRFSNPSLKRELVFGNRDLIFDGFSWRYNITSYNYIIAKNKWVVNTVEVFRIQKQ